MHYNLLQARVAVRTFRKSIFIRAHHMATGRFTTINPQGTLASRDVKIWLGDPGSAYVMFDPEISRAWTKDQELYPLNFYHDTRHFSHKSSDYPRLEIPQDLPQQSNANHSPATLHAFGVTHSITLDGTEDAEFHHMMESSLKQMQPVLDILKDM